jgi:hypothetical protein
VLRCLIIVSQKDICAIRGVPAIMSEPRLEHQNVKVKQLIDDYRSGRIVIPEFQRDYVWKKSKAPLEWH